MQEKLVNFFSAYINDKLQSNNNYYIKKNILTIFRRNRQVFLSIFLSIYLFYITFHNFSSSKLKLIIMIIIFQHL